MKLRKISAYLRLFTCVLALYCTSPGVNATTEEDIRSAVIVAMLRFTTWQAEEVTARENLKLCSYGSPLSQQRLDIGIQEAPAFGKQLSHEKLKNPDRLAGCDVVILGPKSEPVLSAAQLKDKLSICDGCIANRKIVVAIIELIDDNIKFDINLESADKAGIKLSSDLLILANEVKRKPNDAES